MMSGSYEEVRVVEEKPSLVFERPVVAIEGLPDVGLVGTIATTFLVEKKGFEEIAYLESDLFPPVMVVHEGRLKNPFRIYGGYLTRDEAAEGEGRDGSSGGRSGGGGGSGESGEGGGGEKEGEGRIEATARGESEEREAFKINTVLVLSEIAVPPYAVFPLTRALSAWFKEKGVQLAISLTGLAVRNRMEIEEPEVFGVANSEAAVQELRKRGVEIFEEGFIAGIYASMLRECKSVSVDAIALLTQCFPAYPDPGAAASALKTLEKFVPLRVDVGELLKRAEEIKLKARDLMRQTSIAASQMQKNAEQDLPIMYR
ncbi:MAG: PAC2 family protein [Candidatus Methanospirare jalkutatii]|nr:PAC2 family protein [Candidatus Methanospirare jalkutatii]